MQTPNRQQPQRNNSSAENDDVGNLDQYVQQSDYDVTKEQIFKRLAALEARVGDHSSLAASFKEAFEKDKDVDKMLISLMSDLLQRDDLRKALSDAVGKADRQWLVARLKSVWGFVVAALLVALGALLDHFLHNGH